MGGGAATTCLVSTSTQAPGFASNDPARVVGLPPPCVHIHASPRFRATTQHGRWGCHRLSCILPVHASPSISQATTQDPAWAVGLPPPVLRPHRKPPISRNDPARAVGLPPPVLHPHCPRKAPRSREQRPRTQQPHCPSCVHIHASPRFRATTQHGRWSCHRLSCILTVHARPPDLASNDPA